MSEHRIGDEVLAPWANDGFLYPAILVHEAGPTAHVAYLDGDEADVPVASLRQGVFGPGLRVSVNWKGRRAYYDGVIRQRVGAAVFVEYEDGDRGWTTVAQCRVRIDVVQQIAPALVACGFCGAAIDGSLARCPQCGGPRPGRN